MKIKSSFVVLQKMIYVSKSDAGYRLNQRCDVFEVIYRKMLFFFKTESIVKGHKPSEAFEVGVWFYFSAAELRRPRPG